MADPTPEELAAKAEADRIAAEAKAATEAREAVAAKAKADEAKLGDAGKAALDAERKTRREAEKALKDAQARLDALEAEKLSKEEQAEKRASEAESKVAAATEKLRRANLLSALQAAGVANAKAAARLVDGVQYDDQDEPVNLDDAVKAAKTEYGDTLFKAGKPAAGRVNGGEGTQEDKQPALTAEELSMAQSFGMTPQEYEAFKDPTYQGPPKEPVKT